MPIGVAARIHRHLHQSVQDARKANTSMIVFRAGDVRDNLELTYRDAVMDVCQVLETRKLQREAGLVWQGKDGPRQGAGTCYRFRIL